MTRRQLILALIVGVTITLGVPAKAAGISVIVQLTPTASANTVTTALGGTLVDSIPEANQYLINFVQVPLLDATSMATLGIQWLETNTGVALQPMGQFGVLQVPSSAAADWYKFQPSLQLVRSQQALSLATGQGVVVADINSQVDYSHSALRGHLTSGYDFVSSKPTNETALNQSDSSFLDQSDSSFLDQSDSSFLDQSDSSFLDQNGAGFLSTVPVLGSKPAYSHGTLCVGIIAVMAPDAMIMPLRAFDDQGSSDTYMLSKAIRFAVNHGSQVINMSFGTLVDSKAIHSAIDYAKSRNVVLVASAGNNNTSAVQYPAAYAGVTSVSATDVQDVRGSFSNYGWYVGVDAPGVNITSAYPGGLYSTVSGTSFSSPMVAAAAALVVSIKMSGVMRSVTSTAVNIDAKNPNYVGQLGTGRIDVVRSLQ